ncbi:MAG: SDR family NAD(P)-dependent oxidoreductase [Patulibacter sp.]
MTINAPGVASGDHQRPLAVVTGATAGIGRELARVFAENDFDVVVSAEDDRVDGVADELRKTSGVTVHGVRSDLATFDGCEQLVDAVAELGRPIDAIALNAGVGVTGDFARDTELRDHLRLIDLNVSSTVHLARRFAPAMIARKSGRILITSSVAISTPVPYQSTYAASKAFVHSFAQALRSELEDSGVTVTALQPGGTDTEFWARSGAEDSQITRADMSDPADIARTGYDAMMRGDDHVIAGKLSHKLAEKVGAVLPDKLSARLTATATRPRGTGRHVL